jgi:1,2-dihydroxy-3-keto-5-methylthiopentene dioxygenase
MSQLRIYPENNSGQAETISDYAEIARRLQHIGVRFERWQANQPLQRDSSQDEVLAAYREPVARLMQENGFQAADVVSLHPQHPDRAVLRQKFLNEHTHSEDEVRFFVDGSGQFYLHPNQNVYVVRCEQGDLMSVPAGVKHWFDMGDKPDFKCIRLFTNPAGWVAQFTGDTIAERFPRFGE